MTGYHADGEALTAASRELTAAADALHTAADALAGDVGGTLGSDRLTAAAAALTRSTSADLATTRDAMRESSSQVAAALAAYHEADDAARDRLR
jgi:hypothetical protein